MYIYSKLLYLYLFEERSKIKLFLYCQYICICVLSQGRPLVSISGIIPSDLINISQAPELIQPNEQN